MRRRRAGEVVGIALLVTSVLAASGCGGNDADAPRTATEAPVTSTALVPADSGSPAAGVCAEAQPEWAVATIDEDVPDPRCEYVTVDERLRVVNATKRTVTVTFADESVELRPGAVESFDRPFGEYLAPGVHVVHASLYGGSGTELWLRDAADESPRG